MIGTGTEHDCVELTNNVNKALNPQEKPLDFQLTRNIILLSHRLKDGNQQFWNNAREQQLLTTTSRFSAWKFCCLLHRLLNTGNNEILRVSQMNRAHLQRINDYWAREEALGMDVGVPIVNYCRMLLFKISFHEKYSFFSADLSLKSEQNWELNLCFELATEIFDYLESLLQLLTIIFNSLAQKNLSVKSTRAECRLTPVITIVTECSALYRHSLTVMRVLATVLPTIDLIGLSDRFNVIFKQLHNCTAYLRSLNNGMETEFVPELPAIAPVFCATTRYENELPMPSAPLESELD